MFNWLFPYLYPILVTLRIALIQLCYPVYPQTAYSTYLIIPWRHHARTQTARDPLASETERLAFDIIFYTLGRRTGRASDDIARCLRTSVDRMLDKHALVFNSMVGRLRLNRSSDLRQGFLDLSDELFQREEVRLRTASFLV